MRDIISLIIRDKLHESLEHLEKKSENVYSVTELIRCTKQNEYLRLFRVPNLPNLAIINGILTHLGIQVCLSKYENFEIEVDYTKTIKDDDVYISTMEGQKLIHAKEEGKEIQVVGRIDIQKDNEIWEIKTLNAIPQQPPSEHYILQCRIYLWLTGADVCHLIELSRDEYRITDITEPVTDMDVLLLIYDKKSPRWEWECEYCPYKNICTEKIKRRGT